MDFYPIALSVIRPSWGPANPQRATGDIGAAADQLIFERDDHTCRCCGFRAPKYQEVLHLNGDARDFDPQNVMTTCIFCHQCFDLNAVARMDSGMLIWLPELTQSDLHHIMRAVYLGRVAQGGLGSAAKDIYAMLMKRGEAARRRLGSADPGALAVILRDFMTHRQYLEAQKKLDGIRLLPLDRRMIKDGELEYNQFPQILAYWRSKNGPLAHMPAQDWTRLFATIEEAA